MGNARGHYDIIRQGEQKIMAKKQNYKFTMKDFLKFAIGRWYVLVVFLGIGAIMSVFSWRMQEVTYSLETTVLVHDKEDTAGDIDEYEQLTNVLSSKGAYENAGINDSEEKITGVKITSGGGKGVLTLTATGASEEAVRGNTKYIINNAEIVLNKLYGKDRFEVYTLRGGEDLTVKGAKRDKVFSVAIIMAAMVVATFSIDFLGFRKRVSHDE